MKIDIFTHILPKRYNEKMLEIDPQGKDIDKRVRAAIGIIDVEERFRVMDRFGEYAQILSLVTPPVESYGPPAVARELAQIANDGMAELVQKYPDRFLGFVAALPMNDPDGLLVESKRAVNELGAVGVQVMSNILGRPLDKPDTMPLFDMMAELDRPVWIHPIRGADFPDYQSEPKSHYEIWWCFGWAYETSAAMAHLVFSGLFDKHPNLKIITHHLGGIIPYVEGKIGYGWDALGTRTSDEDYTLLLKRLKKRPIDYFRMFYADTAIFGAKNVATCGLNFFGDKHVLFGSDMPFGPKETSGWLGLIVDMIEGMDITPEQRKAIYEDNTRRILNLR
jgi:predicted TIM-barrel fold metal-dependent hydrolase